MRFFMRNKAEKSLRDFDKGLQEFFSTTRKYRSSLRRGSIVLLDDDSDMFDFLMFLTKKCGLDVGVIHVTEAVNAKQAVKDLGAYNVKAVLIDSRMVEKTLNGDSFPSWLRKECPRVPVWVVNCKKETGSWIRSQSAGIGVIEEEATLARVAETIGFPDECQKFIKEFVS